MKTLTIIGASLLIGGLGLVGCKKEETTTPSQPATPPVRTTTPTLAAPATQPAVQVPKVDIAPAVADIQAKATSLLEQAQNYIKENKYDLADKALSEVEAMGDSLTPTLKSRVGELRAMLKVAKTSTLSPESLPSLNK